MVKEKKHEKNYPFLLSVSSGRYRIGINCRIGIFGFNIPESIDKLPEEKKESGFKIEIKYWEYGEVAEILHIGPDSEIVKTVDKLQKFIPEQEYKIIGAFEAEYIKSPEFPNTDISPEESEAFVRFRVAKKS